MARLYGLAVCAVLLGTTAAFASDTGRKMMGEESFRRQLMAISANATGDFSISAFGTGRGDGNCYIQGYPGSRGDATVSGPLTVSLQPSSKPFTLGFTKGSAASIRNYNYSGYLDSVKLSQNETYGLISVSFTPQTPGQFVNIFSGLVTNGQPITSPTCLVNVTLVVAKPTPSPISTPPPAPTSTATPTPSSAACTGAVPCYCQNGYCFNNGATLSQTCRPPAGQTCTPVTIAPSAIGAQYASGYPSTVNVCKCSS